jgi:ubiquinone biosynthesis protein
VISSTPRSRIELGVLGSLVTGYLRGHRDLLPDLDLWLDPTAAEPGEPLAFPAVRELIAGDLEREIESAYAWIDPNPIRHSPLTQIHLAQTVGGREVVIKLRRPDAADIVSRALPALLRATDELAQLAGLSAAEGAELARGLRHWLAEEIDAPGELANLQRLQLRGRHHPAFFLPRPRVDLSGPLVLVFEARRGVPFDELARLVAEKRLDQISRLELNRVELGNNLVRTLLHQIFIAESFVSHLMPEHLIALPDDRVSLLDFSHVARVDPIIRRNQFRYVAAIGAVDAERILAAITELAEPPSYDAREAFAEAFRRQLRQWERDEEWETTRSDELAKYLLETARLARRHGYRIDESTLTLLRALWSADSIAKQLSARGGLGTVAPAFFSPRWLLGLLQEVWQERFPSLGFDLVDLLTDGPGNFVRILSDIADRRFVLRVQAIESPESRRAAADRSRLMAVSGLIIAVAVAGAALWLSTHVPIYVWAMLGALVLALLLVFALLWRRLE